MADTVQQIKDRLSITDVVGQYVKLTRSGASLKARCPFHAERTPSFHVSPDRGTYHCFGCGAGGDIFTFVEQIEGLDFKGALKVLAERAGVAIEYSREKTREKDERDRLFSLLEASAVWYASRMTDDARAYLHERGLSDATIARFRLGLAGSDWSGASDYLRTKQFSEKEIADAGLAKRSERGQLVDRFRNRIMFPIADSAGRVVGFSGRSFGPDASPEAPKYLNSPETPLFRKSRIFYGFDKAKQAMRTLGCALLVEGQVDLLACHQAGWENTVAVSGTAFTTEHAALLKRFTDNLILALDADEAGIKAAGRAARASLQGGLNVKVARLPDSLDPAEFILKDGSDAWKAAIRDAKDIVVFLLDILQARFAPGQEDRLRRAVESAVLPFVADAGSPIAREQYMRLIAGRLGVSEAAVEGALAKVPAAARESFTHEAEEVEGHTTPAPSFAHNLGRARQVFAIIAWQERLPQPMINVPAMRIALEEAIGKEDFALLASLPESEKEALRFSAERLYGARRSPEKDCTSQIMLLLRERLSRELVEVSSRLKRAEAAGEHESAGTLLEQSRLLTARIAQLHTEMYNV